MNRIITLQCFIPHTENKGVRLDLVSLALELDVPGFSVHCRQLREQMGRVNTHGEAASLKVRTTENVQEHLLNVPDSGISMPKLPTLVANCY